jgi:hypothetical protein
MLPISFANSEIGMDNDSGNALNGASGLPGVAGLAAGVDVVVGAGVGAGAGVAALGAVVVVVAFGTVVVVVESFDVDEEGITLDVAAPAGPRPASTLAAARTRPPVSTAIEVRGFRLKMVLLLLCMGYTGPALSPQRWG